MCVCVCTQVGKYLTPNRLDIDRLGIQPDFASRPSPRLAAETINACKLARPPPRPGLTAGSNGGNDNSASIDGVSNNRASIASAAGARDTWW